MRIVDLHCDTLSAILTGKRSLWENDRHLDVKRAREAGILLQFFALYSGKREYSPALRDCLVQVEGLLQTLEQFPDELLFIKTRQDLKELSADGTRMGCLLHLEGGEALGMEPEILVIFTVLGLRSLDLPGITATNWPMVPMRKTIEGGSAKRAGRCSDIWKSWA